MERPNHIFASEPFDQTDLLFDTFFPTFSSADLFDLEGFSYLESLEFPPVTSEEVANAIRNAGKGKKPGLDDVPNSLLIDYLKIFSPQLVFIFNECLRIGYHPACFKEALTVVLRKPGKDNYTTPKAYRPIALLSTIGKALESIMASRLMWAVETHDLLPRSHLGGRRGTSTEHACHALLEQVHAAWRNGGVASLLCLDVQGAFDNVSHKRLLHCLRKRKIGGAMLAWCESFLSDRHTYIQLGDHRSPRTRVRTGIAQGSPVSPIFYIFYNSDLLESCTNRTQRTQATGYIDDTSIMVMGDSAEENVEELYRLHEEQAQPWAARHASIFAPKKYQLMHFYSPYLENPPPLRVLRTGCRRHGRRR